MLAVHLLDSPDATRKSGFQPSCTDGPGNRALYATASAYHEPERGSPDGLHAPHLPIINGRAGIPTPVSECGRRGAGRARRFLPERDLRIRTDVGSVVELLRHDLA